MTHQVDLDDEIFSLLQAQAQPFTDTPNSVLRRLLKLDPDTSTNHAGTEPGRAKASPGNSSRAAVGTLLPEERYEMPLLTTLMEMGGEASTRAVRDAVGELLQDELTAQDREPLASGDIRWQNRLQFVRLRLVERGFLESNSPRGIWQISSRGRDAVRNGHTRASS